MDPYLNKGIGDVMVEEPFCKASCVETRRFDGIITIRDGDDMVWSIVDMAYRKGSIWRIRGFLRVGTTFDIFQNIHILYYEYGILVFSGYDVLILFPSWSLVSAGTDTPYLP
ncbi:hypothetical protein Tco_0620617 [Tanacetum coccineum]